MWCVEFWNSDLYSMHDTSISSSTASFHSFIRNSKVICVRGEERWLADVTQAPSDLVQLQPSDAGGGGCNINTNSSRQEEKNYSQNKKKTKKSFHRRRIFTEIIPAQRQKHSELGAGSAPLMCSIVEGDCSGDQSTCVAAAAAGEVTCHTVLNYFFFKTEI